MDKNRFLLFTLLGVVILVYLFNTYQKIKQQKIEDYQNYTTLLTKIKEIKYLQNKLKPKNLNRLKKCTITNNEKIIINCQNLDKQSFKTDSNIIFNSNFNISKFKITSNSIYVEILK